MLNQTLDNLAYMKKSTNPAVMGDRIREAREALKLTQEDLGSVAGISGTAVSLWESGDTKSIKPEHLFKIARKLRKSAEWLVTGEGTQLPREELYDALSQLPADTPQQSLDFIQYQIEKAEGVIASDKIARYVAMIEDFKRDMERRKKT